MLEGSALELSWDYEIENSLEPALKIKYTGNSSLFSSSPSNYTFEVTHRTYSPDSDSSMTTTTKIRGISALAAYMDLRCEAAGQWRLATIVDKQGVIVYELGSKTKTSRNNDYFGFAMFSNKSKWTHTHSELLEVWRNTI